MLPLYVWTWIDSTFPDSCPRLISQSTSPVGGLYVHGSFHGLHGGAQSWPSNRIPSDWCLYPVFSCYFSSCSLLWFPSLSFACEDFPFYILFNIYIYCKLTNISVLPMYCDGGRRFDALTQVRSLGQEHPLEVCTATHSSILARRIPMDRRAWWATVHGVTKSRT